MYNNNLLIANEALGNAVVNQSVSVAPKCHTAVFHKPTMKHAMLPEHENLLAYGRKRELVIAGIGLILLGWYVMHPIFVSMLLFTTLFRSDK